MTVEATPKRQPTKLRPGAQVVIDGEGKLKFHGCRATVVARIMHDRFYNVDITHDADGKRLREPLRHGLYARSELRRR